jgi:hypothetical protein
MIEVLRAALKQAVANNLLQRNPCDGVSFRSRNKRKSNFSRLTNRMHFSRRCRIPITGVRCDSFF